MRTIKWSKPNRRRDGHVGARAALHITGEGGYDGHYAISTHGLSSAQVAERMAKIEKFHEDRVSRVKRYGGLMGVVSFLVGTDEYLLTDLTIMYPSDAAHCWLYANVRRIGARRSERVAGFPMRKLYASPAAIPADAAVLEMIRAAIPDVSGMQQAHEEFVAKVNARRA